MIMSAFLLVRNVLMRPPKGGHVEEDGDERRRTEAGGGAGASGERRAAFGGCGSADGPELPADGTGVEAILGGRRDGAEAPQRGATVEPGVRRKFSAQDPEAGARAIWRACRRTLWSDPGGGASDLRGRAEGGRGDVAAVDAGRRVVEPGEEGAEASAEARAQGALRRDGAEGWKLSRLVGGARAERVLDGSGRRRHEHHAGALGGGGNHLGGGGGARGLDRALRGAAGAVRGLEEPLPALRHGKERLRGEEPITQFGRMCAKLGIELIAASSPQAQGRVERVHGTHQDRLVKKMRRKQMASQAEANAYLESEYLPEHNRRFAREAARPEDYHRRAPGPAELHKIFRLESERTLSDDWVVRYENRFFQLEPQSRNYAPARGRVAVCEWQMSVWRSSTVAARCRG